MFLNVLKFLDSCLRKILLFAFHHTSSLHEKVLDFTLKYTKDTESESDVKDDARKSRLGSRVESHGALVLHDLLSAVKKSLIFTCIDTLKARLDNINWVVGHDGAESSETTSNKITHDLHANVVL